MAPGRYFFVTGSPKSGTVWLTYTLNSHPEVFITGEGVFFGRDPVGAENWLDRKAIEGWLREQAGWRDGATDTTDQFMARLQRTLVGSIMEARAKASDKTPKVIGDKSTVVYAAYPERLHTVFPGARLIQIIRDGRDVAVSYFFHVLRIGDFKQFRKATQARLNDLAPRVAAKEPIDGRLFCDETLAFFAHLWSQSVRGRTRARELFGANAMEVRYEDLLAEPTRVADVFRLLGVDSSPAMVERCVAANTFERLSGGRSRGQADATSHFRKGEAGDWINHFTPRDRALFARTAGEDLIELGYEPDASWVEGSEARATAPTP